MTERSPRLLGLALDASADFRRDFTGKNAGIFAALDRTFALTAVLRPELGPTRDLVRRLATVHPRRATWRSRYNSHPDTFRARSEVAGRLLAAWEGRFDLVVQLHTLLGPGTRPGRYPFVLHTDNTYLLSERNWPAWAPLRGRTRARRLELEGEVYRSAAAIFPRSEWLRRSLVEDYGCDPARVIPVGGGANLVTPGLGTRRWDTQVALFVGLDFERKGGHVLLAAWEIVRRALPRARLEVVAPGRPPSGLPSGVRWMGRIAGREALRARYLNASVFVMPSLFEPWGHVFYEAMGQGLPCVGSNCCAIPEIIADGVNGRLVPKGEAAPLAEILIGLLGRPEEAERLGRAGHASVTAHHGWDDVVARMAPTLRLASGVDPNKICDDLLLAPGS